MNKDAIRKEYSNDTITVVWQSGLCIHSGNCVKNLKAVFRPREQPWIQLEHASNGQIIETVNKCPSGALSLKTKK
jgi:uncharacterized Fe-S cluster protein YjdI